MDQKQGPTATAPYIRSKSSLTFGHVAITPTSNSPISPISPVSSNSPTSPNGTSRPSVPIRHPPPSQPSSQPPSQLPTNPLKSPRSNSTLQLSTPQNKLPANLPPSTSPRTPSTPYSSSSPRGPASAPTTPSTPLSVSPRTASTPSTPTSPTLTNPPPTLQPQPPKGARPLPSQQSSSSPQAPMPSRPQPPRPQPTPNSNPLLNSNSNPLARQPPQPPQSLSPQPLQNQLPLRPQPAQSQPAQPQPVPTPQRQPPLPQSQQPVQAQLQQPQQQSQLSASGLKQPPSNVHKQPPSTLPKQLPSTTALKQPSTTNLKQPPPLVPKQLPQMPKQPPPAAPQSQSQSQSPIQAQPQPLSPPGISRVTPSISNSPQPPRAQPPQRPPIRPLQTSLVNNQPQPNYTQSQPPRSQPVHSPPSSSPTSPTFTSSTSPTSPTGQPPKPFAKQPPTRSLVSSAPISSALPHFQSSPNLPRPPPARPTPPPPSSDESVQRNASMPILSRSHSMQFGGNGGVELANGQSKGKAPPVSPRRVQTTPLLERLTEKDIAAIIRVQSYVRGWVRRRKFKKLVKDNIHRTKVVRELLSSEETYVISLNIINQTYLEQLTWNSKVSPNPLLNAEQINTIFSTVAGITSFNQTLLEKLRERVNAWGPTQLIGDVFLTMAPFLKLYTTYCTNYDQAIQTLQKAKQAANFATFLETCLKTTSHTLESLLITVVQRIPRYILLLQDFIKHTWPEHVDYINLTSALKSVQEYYIIALTIANIAVKLNKGIGEAESLNKVVVLQSAIVGLDEPLVTPSRMYIRDGPIVECSLEAKVGKEIEKYWYFLFNDSLIITERKKDDKYQFRSMVDFTHDTSMRIKEVPDNLVVQNAFQIVSPTLSLFLSCQDAPTKVQILEQSKQFRDQVAHRLNLVKPQDTDSNKSDDINGIGSELTVTIPRTETCKDGKKEYTLYHTKIRDDKTKKGTIISKRYSEFDHLHKALKKEFPDMDFMDLPKKHLVGSMSKETVESRRMMLEMYLQALVQRPEIRASPTFIEFIQGYTAPPSSKKTRKLTLSGEG